jgi:tRNA modification GTPase
LVVLTKCDLPRYGEPPHGAIPTSSVTQDGLEQLKAAIREKVIHTASDESPVVAGTASRCRESLFEASACLTQAIELAACEQGEELVAAELHGALEHLGRVAGTVYTDDILDRIFSRFCIGK